MPDFTIVALAAAPFLVLLGAVYVLGLVINDSTDDASNPDYPVVAKDD